MPDTVQVSCGGLIHHVLGSESDIIDQTHGCRPRHATCALKSLISLGDVRAWMRLLAACTCMGSYNICNLL